jgi:hypothetical protein
MFLVIIILPLFGLVLIVGESFRSERLLRDVRLNEKKAAREQRQRHDQSRFKQHKGMTPTYTPKSKTNITDP